MSDAASAHLAVNPCGFTQDKLIDLLKEASLNSTVPALFTNYFFANNKNPTKHPKRDELASDDMPRCKKCVCTIGEHLSVTVADATVLETSPIGEHHQQEAPPAKKLRTEQAVRWDKCLYASVKDAAVPVLKNVTCMEEQTDGSMKNVSRDVHFLKTAGGMPWFGATDGDPVLPADELLMRQWHDDLWTLQKSRLTAVGGVIVIGTPGIGKSMALNYFLYKYLNLVDETTVVAHKRYVALILPNLGKYYIFDTKDKVACWLDISTSRGVDDLIPFNDELFVLHDLGSEKPLTPRNLPTIVATSPKLEKYHEFSKGGYRQFFAPLLDNVEMTALSKKVHSSFSYAAVWPGGVCKCWQEAAFFYGNVPRSVFSTHSDSDQINKQLTNLTLANLADMNGLPTMKVNDLLAELIPTSPDYTTSKYRYRPGFVTDEIAFKQLAAKLDEWQKIVKFTSGGHMFEAILHRFLAKFPERLRLDDMWSLCPASASVKLISNAELRKYWPTAGSWKAVPFSSHQRTSLKRGVYYYPTKPNFAVVDSFFFLRPKKKIVLICFQITMQGSHKTKGQTLQKFIEEFASLFVLEGSSLSILDKAAGLTLMTTSADNSTASYALEVHLIHLTQDSTFAYQELKEGVEKDKQLWSRIRQYCCSQA